MGTAPGPRTKGGNRYSALSEVVLSEPRHKKPKQSYQPLNPYPGLPKINNQKNPRFIVIASADEDKPLSSVSIFGLKKAIDAISTEYEQISLLRDGKILILTKNQAVADRFIATKILAKLWPVTITPHKQLNSSKGIVYAPWLINVPEKEIVDEMTEQKVTEVYKFTKQVDGNQRPSGLLLFTFDTYQVPNSVEIGFFNAKVTEYIPNPMRCRNCQLLGHTTKRCNNTPMCNICNFPPHTESECSRVMCANCLDPHPSSSKDCPKFLQMKEIIKVKTQKKCSMADAKRIYNEQFPSQINTNHESFANRANRANLKPTSSSPPIENEKNTQPQTTVSPIPTNNSSISTNKTLSENEKTEPNTITPSDHLPPFSSPPQSLVVSTQAAAAALIKAKKTNANTIQNNSNTKPTTTTSHIINQTQINELNTSSTSSHSNIPFSQPISNTANSLSPLDRATQALIDNNNYFVPMEDDESI